MYKLTPYNTSPSVSQLTPLYYAKRLRSYEGFPTPPQQVKFPKAVSTNRYCRGLRLVNGVLRGPTGCSGVLSCRERLFPHLLCMGF